MAQPPLRLDALEIVGDSGVGTRLIHSDATTGEFLFSDAVVSARKLAEIVGLQGVDGVIICGSGDGVSKDANNNPITTVQAAFAAVPTAASATNPWLILVMPGVYIEDVYADRDGVHLRGLGNVVIRNATSNDTLTILEGPFSVPRRVTFEGVRFENTDVSSACVTVTSALYATGTITVSNVTLAGDTVSIAGITLAAIASGVPVAGEFLIGATFDDTATNLTTAINDPINTPLDTTVKAFVSGSVITLRAQVPGLAGNAITMATSVPATFVLSGATLAGGVDSAAGSTVANDRIAFLNCDLVPSGATGQYMNLASINNIYVQGGDSTGSSTGATWICHECARLEVVGTGNVSRFDLRYDSGGTLPFIATSSYVLRDLTASAAVTVTFVGVVGSLEARSSRLSTAFTLSGGAALVVGSEVSGSTTVGGGGALTAQNSSLGTLNVTGASSATLTNCTRSTLTGDATSTVAETLSVGSLAFAAAPAATYTFPVPQPDAAYNVHLDSTILPAAVTDIPVVTSRAAASFTVTFGAPQTTTVGFTVTR